MNFEMKEPSLSDIFDGVGDANWAEHQWIKSQLEVARIQQDLNDTTEHNYRLFLKYQEIIEPQE